MRYGRFEVQRELGRGSMGVVYLAYDPDLDRLVAVKVLREDRLVSEDFVERFLREARAMGRLSPHPHIVTVFDVGRDHGTVYIAMEYLEGEALSDLMRRRPFSLDEIVDLGVQVAETLDHAHRKGIVHRDIKPSNIIVMPGGAVKITDFGIAHIEDPSIQYRTQAGEILGTPVYMSPEQVIGQRVDGRSDLYSLGVILYELAVGVRPFRGENLAAIFRAITQDEPVDPVAENPAVPAVLGTLILRALQKPAEARFQTGAEMAAALEAGLKALVPPPVPPVEPPVFAASTPPSVRAPSEVTVREGSGGAVQRKGIGRPTPLLIVLVALVLGAAGALGYHFLKQEPVPQEKQGVVEQTPSVEETTPEQVPPQARLVVESFPEGAQVFVDQSYRGETPLGLDLPAGTYEVLVEKKGFHAWEAQLTLAEARETPLSVRLLPEEEGQP
ncbi:serine/threonine-protein kinase [Desulfatiglans anilini]|uniref:serine/threonine-protein kinase n=1 Tax=Desulfatiglans anilini TaxID=90728 RepID=UPI000423B4BE|nr:serine/threonine-protein kinase [Desulfatiglans anilini]